MFEGEERWSRNCGSGIGLSNYKNVYRDNILCGNWQEDQYGDILPDRTNQVRSVASSSPPSLLDNKAQQHTPCYICDPWHEYARAQWPLDSPNIFQSFFPLNLHPSFCFS